VNEATLASFGEDKLAHYFVVLRDKNGLHTINAQKGDAGPLKQYIQFMEDNGYAKDTFYIVSSRQTLSNPKDYDKVTMRIVKKYFPTKHEVDGTTGPDRGLTKAQRRHHRKLFRSWGIETSPNTNVNSSVGSSIGSNEEWTIPTSRSRSGRRAKSERKRSIVKSSKTLSQLNLYKDS
jgi:hypothetical protein